MRPEFPFLAAGAVAFAGGVKRENGIPKNPLPAVVGTIALVILASATAGSAVAPLVRAFGLLILMAAVFSTVRAYQGK